MPTVLISARAAAEPARAVPRDPHGRRVRLHLIRKAPHTMSEEELRDLARVDAMIAGGEPLTAELLDVAPRLRVIARTGVGYDAIDVEAATARRDRGLHHAGDEPGERGRAGLRPAAGADPRIVDQRPRRSAPGGGDRILVAAARGARRSAWSAWAGSAAPWRPGAGLRDARPRLRPGLRPRLRRSATASVGSGSTSCWPSPTSSACTCRSRRSRTACSTGTSWRGCGPART